MPKKILLIGAGPTSSIVAYNLKQVTEKFKCPLEIHLWEKSRGIGGRFSTSRSPKNTNCFADLGAQYLTQTQNNSWSKPYFDCLTKNGIIRKFRTSDVSGFKNNQENKENFVCLQGTAAVVKFFLNQAEVTCTHFNRKVESISIKDCNGLKRVEVTGQEVASDGNQSQSELFDAVILTVPVPQILQLKNADALVNCSGVRPHLAGVKYSSRFALGLFYDAPLKLKSGEKAVNYIDNDPVLRYWSVENEKREMGHSATAVQSTGSAVVIHTTVKFGTENVEKNLNEMEEVLLKHIDGKIKTIEDIPPTFIKCHKWRYSQVEVPYLNSPGFVVLSESPAILAAGDGFTYSGFEGCILSAEKTVQHLVSLPL